MLQPAEDAAGRHGSAPGAGGGGAGLQLRLSSSHHQPGGEELQRHKAGVHHHVRGTVLPKGDGAHRIWRRAQVRFGALRCTDIRVCVRIRPTGPMKSRVCVVATGPPW